MALPTNFRKNNVLLQKTNLLPLFSQKERFLKNIITRNQHAVDILKGLESSNKIFIKIQRASY
jgi:hypothetical protein